MNSKQTRKQAREFIKEVLQMLPEEYNKELTVALFEANRRIEVLERQLYNRDGVLVLAEINEED